MKRLMWILALGLALALGGCGSDDDGGGDGNGGTGGGGGNGGSGGNGGTSICDDAEAAANASFVASCVVMDLTCMELRGNFTYATAEQTCSTSFGTTASDQPCSAEFKSNGACVINVQGAVIVSYYSADMPISGAQEACETNPSGCWLDP